MMRRLLALLLLSIPLSATTPNISGCYAPEVHDKQVMIRCTVDQAGDTFLKYDTDDVSLDLVTQTLTHTASPPAEIYGTIIGITPGTKIFWQMVSTNGGDTSADKECSVNCTDCDSTDDSFFADNSNLDCVIGESPSYTPPSEEVCAGGPPCYPTAPTHNVDVSSGHPACTNTRSPDATCSDLAKQIADAASAANTGGAGTVECVTIPTGEANACRLEDEGLSNWTLPTTGDGVVVVKSAADVKQLPPVMGRFTPSWFKGGTSDSVSYIERNATDLTKYNEPHFIRGGGTGTYWFGPGIVFRAPPWADIAQDTYNVSAVDTGTDTITLTEDITATDLANGNVVYVDLAGTDILGGQGPALACNVNTTNDTIQLRRGTCSGTLYDLTGGPYTSGGTIQRQMAQPITSHADCGDGTHCIDVSGGHGIPNYIDATITAGTTATVTIGSETPADYFIEQNFAVWVQDNHANCSGRFEADVVSGSDITLLEATDCTSGGTIRRLHPLNVADTRDPDFDRVWHFNAVDADTIQLLGSTFDSTLSGGVVAYEMDQLQRWVSSDSTGIIFDRVAFDCPKPCRSWFGVIFGVGGNNALGNSWVNLFGGTVVDPISTASARTFVANAEDSTTLVVNNTSDDNQVVNTTFWPIVDVFADVSSQPTDLTMRGNDLFNASWTVSAHPNSDGNESQYVAMTEFKSVERLDFRGNYIHGAAAKGQITGSAISLTLSTGSGTHSREANISLKSNIITKSATFFQNALGNSGGAQELLPNLNLEISHNLVVDMDPRNFWNTPQAGPSNGSFLAIGLSNEDYNIERNTFHTRLAKNPRLIWWDAPGHATGHRNRDNIYTYHGGESGTSDGIEIGRTLANAGTAGDKGSTAFDAIFRLGAATDSTYSSFAGNVLIPGLENSNGDYDTNAAATGTSDDTVTICADELAAPRAGIAGFEGTNTIVGASGSPCADSFNDRLDLVFQSGTWEPVAGQSTKGADLAQIRTDGWWNGDVTVSATTTTATISFTSPDNDECAVDLAHTNLDFSVAGNITRQTTANGATTSKSTQFTSLSAGTQYAYRISCKRPALRGLVTTAE